MKTINKLKITIPALIIVLSIIASIPLTLGADFYDYETDIDCDDITIVEDIDTENTEHDEDEDATGSEESIGEGTAVEQAQGETEAVSIVTTSIIVTPAATDILINNSITGWEKINNRWYYYKSGVMASNEWLLWNNQWYYLKSDGVMAANESLPIGGKTYYFKSSGVMAKNEWLLRSGKWYFYNPSGAMAVNQWRLSGNKWYYLKSNGVMAANEVLRIGGVSYRFNAGGAMITGWFKSGNNWLYYKPSGAMAVSQWLKSGNVWYYLKSNGVMAVNEALRIGGVDYRFNAGGAMVTGWFKSGNNWLYYKSSGAMAKNEWLKIDGMWYNFNSSGVLAETLTQREYEIRSYASEVLRLTNIERAKYNLPALSSADSTLNQAAMTRARETVTYWSHTRPNGRSCFTAYTDLGGTYSAMGENIAYGYGTPKAVVDAWMASPGHRANILTPGFTHLGVGVTVGNGGAIYWVQLFLG